MRDKFEDKKDDPGMMSQLNKLDKLIDQLQQQEAGYLGELIRLTVSIMQLSRLTFYVHEILFTEAMCIHRNWMIPS